MAGLAEARALYRAYLAEAERVERERKPGEGLFGVGKKPSDDPCHERFATELETLLNAFDAQAPESAQVRELLSYLYLAPKEHPEPRSAFWMLCAVHGLTLDLTARLNRTDAAALFSLYAESYPRWDRLPVQQQVYSALKRASK
jgi:hypothetical protein